MDVESIAISSIINMMEELGINYETQKHLFIKHFDKNKYREVFKKNRNKYLKVGSCDNCWKQLRTLEDGQTLYKLFSIRKQSLNNYGKMINELDENENLWNSKSDILFSLIHMHCNRLVGSREWEEIEMHLVRHTLQSLEYIKNHPLLKMGSN